MTPPVAALTTTLRHAIDYAGLFPPAALSMAAAVAEYHEYSSSPDAWALGRFVLPVSRGAEFHTALLNTPSEDQSPSDTPVWRLSAIAGPDFDEDAVAIREHNLTLVRRARIDTVEAKVSTPEDLRRASRAFTPAWDLFAEVPNDDRMPGLMERVAKERVKGKMRMGGTVPEAIPAPELVVDFFRLAHRHGVAVKATAGLHHAVRGEYPLTYAADAPRGTMHGYLNVMVVAALAHQEAEERELLDAATERDPSAFTVTEKHLQWRQRRISVAQLMQMRTRGLMGFGSCSFREPLDELQKIRVIPE